MPNQHFDVIYFDLGGTVMYFDSDFQTILPQFAGAMVAGMQKAGIPLRQGDAERFLLRMDEYYIQRDTEFLEYTTEFQIRELLNERGLPQPDDGVISDVIREMYAVSQAHWLPMDDTHSTLDALRDQGYRMAAISNASDDRDVQRLVDKAGVREYFEFVLTSAAFGYRKPNPRIFLHAMEQTGAAANRSVMIGDTLGADILGAANVGMASIWLTRYANNSANRGHLDTILPDAKIDYLAELPGVLEAWNSAIK